jgi:hypothetical protein
MVLTSQDSTWGDTLSGRLPETPAGCPDPAAEHRPASTESIRTRVLVVPAGVRCRRGEKQSARAGSRVPDQLGACISAGCSWDRRGKKPTSVQCNMETCLAFSRLNPPRRVAQVPDNVADAHSYHEVCARSKRSRPKCPCV